MKTKKIDKRKDNGRPFSFTVEQVADALLKAAGVITHAADLLGIRSVMTIYNYINKYPQLGTILRQCRLRTTDIAETKLMQAIEKGEQWAILFKLRTHGRDRGYIEGDDTKSAERELEFYMPLRKLSNEEFEKQRLLVENTEKQMDSSKDRMIIDLEFEKVQTGAALVIVKTKVKLRKKVKVKTVKKKRK